MKKNVLLLSLALALAITITGTAYTQAQQTQVKIGDLLREPFGVTLSGKVVSIMGNDFILDDSTGQIIVDGGPTWWHQINLSPSEQVTVVGELDRRGEFDAFSITKADGSVIQIRGPGKPPSHGEADTPSAVATDSRGY
jgi:uncharacterized protein YdeI (BOF family)